jgi:hypothetical protein
VISTHCGRHMQCAVCSWQASVRVGESCVAGTCPFRFNSQIETRDKQSSASENGKTGLVRSPCPVPAEVPLVDIRNWAGWTACG